MKIKFEYRITAVYVIAGGIWIIFSDKLLNLLINDINLLTEIQTYKGWFYVIITGLLFLLFLKRHLSKLRTAEKKLLSNNQELIASQNRLSNSNEKLISIQKELEAHKSNLERMVVEKTDDLEATNEKLQLSNNELTDKSRIIQSQNSELKDTLSNLKETQSHLIQSEKLASLGVLTAGIAHEINNPLNFILGAYVGLENFFKQNEHIKDDKIPILLNGIKTGIDRTSSIVEGLNQFSRDSSTYDEDCDLHSIIENCLAILHNPIKHRITIKKNYTTVPYTAKGNVGKLHQVLINILTNAVQAIENKGQILISTHIENGFIVIEIEDSGCGIIDENLLKITDPFFTTKAPGKGTGLGLYICYTILKEHKGTIDIKSELHTGTTVTISLPLNN